MNNISDSSFSFQNKRYEDFEFPTPPLKKPRVNTIKQAVVHIQPFGAPLISSSSGQFCDSICLQPYKPLTIGRKPKLCDFVFADHRVSRRHCQLLFDSLHSKVHFSDGLFRDCSDCIYSFTSASTRVSLNGAFVNGVRINGVVELCVGDAVGLTCGIGEVCRSRASIGFSVEKIVFAEEVDDTGLIQFDPNALLKKSRPLEFRRVVDDKSVLLSWCRDILCTDDPVSYIQKRVVLDLNKKIDSASRFNCTNGFRLSSNNGSKSSSNNSLQIEYHNRKRVCSREVKTVEKCDDKSLKEVIVVSEENTDFKCTNVVTAPNADTGRDCDGVDIGHRVSACGTYASLSLGEPDNGQHTEDLEDENCGNTITPPGRKFCLNRLQLLGQETHEMNDAVSLPQLFHPIESLKRVFIATFTSDILWFVSYCKIPPHLPVTISCHNAERCWNSDPDMRISVPFSDFPNLTVVYPLFPEVIAFNKDRKNSGIGCHHPKLIVLQREYCLRVIITSANLVARQWHNVTNTVWWQDFPQLTTPDCSSLFTRLSVEETSRETKCDFAAQLAGFMASLVADVPSQAHWILELIKYDFRGAVGYLVASVPGIHTQRSPCVSKSKNYLVGNRDKLDSCSLRLLASVEESVVGLSHIYRASSDSHGTQLKKLAMFLGKCRVGMNGMSEIVLRRDKNIPADKNAVSVHVPNPEEPSIEDFVQLGFLPKHVAKWVAPLSDIGLFAFSAFIYPKEVLATASERSSNKVKLMLYVSEGPSFATVSEFTQLEYVSAVCSLLASSQRLAGLWRLKEVLDQYKWPEHLESELFFGSSSVGSVNAQFLAAFSAAAGKRSVPFADSEESDPEWGCWSASQELKNPSLNIIFPSIDRVKSNRSGIMASRRVLCFSQKTWQRLKNVGILHDAIPYPSGRVGFPMHVKVGRRRFRSKKDGSSFGWIYSGSHNFSAAAWGLPISDGQKSNRSTRNNSALGSRLRISNYELGIIFVVPPPDTSKHVQKDIGNLDDIVLPFIVPPPKYKPHDKPATAQAMREALAELREMEINEAELGIGSESIVEEVPEEEGEEVLEAGQFVAQEKEDEKAYADQLWSQVDSS